MRFNGILLVIICLLGLSVGAHAADKITLYALFQNKVILLVDGERRILALNETSPEGITLIETDTTAELAKVEVDGKSQVLRLGVVSVPRTTASEPKSVTLWAKSGGHFFADGYINGSKVKFVVDTGATFIAMNSKVAKRIGIDYKSRGKPGFASTASGVVQTHEVKLTSVKIGDITLYNVDASITDGNYPTETLLGMSFLGRLDMRQEGQKMTLQKRF